MCFLDLKNKNRKEDGIKVSGNKASVVSLEKKDFYVYRLDLSDLILSHHIIIFVI